MATVGVKGLIVTTNAVLDCRFQPPQKYAQPTCNTSVKYHGVPTRVDLHASLTAGRDTCLNLSWCCSWRASADVYLSNHSTNETDPAAARSAHQWATQSSHTLFPSSDRNVPVARK